MLSAAAKMSSSTESTLTLSSEDSGCKLLRYVKSWYSQSTTQYLALVKLAQT